MPNGGLTFPPKNFASLDSSEAAAAGMKRCVLLDDDAIAVIDDSGNAYRIPNEEYVREITSQMVGDEWLAQELRARVNRAIQIPVPYTSLANPYARVFKDSDGYFSDFIASDYINSSEDGILTYYIDPNGNDSNDGSEAYPKQSLYNLITELNVSNTEKKPVSIYCAHGYYLNGKSFNGVSADFPVNIICRTNGQQAVFANVRAYTVPESTHTTYTNAWQCPIEPGSINIWVIDTKYTDSEGNPIRYSRGSDASAVNTTRGSYNLGGSSILIRTIDDRKPDEHILVVTDAAQWNQVHNHNIFAKGISIYGGDGPLVHDVDGSSLLVFSCCRFLYGRTYNGVTLEKGSHTVIYDRCAAAYNYRDGFSARVAVFVIEIGCVGYSNGFGTEAGSDNGTTTHQACKSIRVNGRYYNNKDRNVHDANSSTSWLVACEAGITRTSGTTEYDSSAFAFGLSSDTQGTLATLTDCKSLGECASDLVLCNRNVRVAYSKSNLRAPHLIGDPSPIAFEIPSY